MNTSPFSIQNNRFLRRGTMLFCAASLLIGCCGCGSKKSDEAVAVEIAPPDITDTSADVVIADSEVWPDEEYNSIDEADSAEIKALKSQLETVANACQSIYAAADKGSALNAVLSTADQQALISAIAELGYPAVDYYQTMDMQCAEPLKSFCESIYLGADGSATYYMVFTDGQISQYTLTLEDGAWHLITMSVRWSENKPVYYSQGRFAIGDVSYTQKGRLIYNRNFTDFDDNQKDNSDSWVFVKVTPTNAELKALCERYIEPISYFENNLFITDWDSDYFNPVDFNSLYAYLFKLYTGTAVLTSTNVYSYYKPVGDTGMYIIPTETFEKVVQNWFDIDSSTLRSISDYSAADGGYFFLGYRFDYYNVLPRTPEPEVTGYWYNEDGTLTIRCEAVNDWYGTDKAFTHDVTLRVNSDGSFKYLSNKVYTDENSILPTNRLDTLRSAKLDEYLNP